MKRLLWVMISLLAIGITGCDSSSDSATSSDGTSITYGTLTDSRDGQTYKTVKIGSQTWMAQNLNYKTDNSWCYDGADSNCTKYGRLYQWAAAMGLSWTYNSTLWQGSDSAQHQGACPSGWHVPSDAEWQSLEVAVGMSAADAATSGWRGTTEGTKLKANSSSLWSTNTGTDVYGISVLPAGYRDNDGAFYGLGNHAYFWSSSGGDASLAWSRYFYGGSADVYRDYNGKSYGLSLRCIQN